MRGNVNRQQLSLCESLQSSPRPRKEGRKEGKPKACSALRSMAKSHGHLHNDPFAFNKPGSCPGSIPCCSSHMRLQTGGFALLPMLQQSLSRTAAFILHTPNNPQTIQTALLAKCRYFVHFVHTYKIQLEVSSTLKLQFSNTGKLVISSQKRAQLETQQVKWR